MRASVPAVAPRLRDHPKGVAPDGPAHSGMLEGGLVSGRYGLKRGLQGPTVRCLWRRLVGLDLYNG
jgi:hypothetical protein